MDRADVIRLARESGNPDAFAIDHGHHLFSLVELERFAALVRAQVIEEAAQLCEGVHWPDSKKWAGDFAHLIRGMKSDSVHPAAADAGASTAPLPCIFCGARDHKEKCDSPGAIVTRTTGCPVHDANPGGSSE